MSNTVGGAEPIQGHGDSVNGRNQTIPAIPSVNGSLSQDHTRKPSMTVTPAGATGFPTNGGYGGPGKSMNVQFGTLPNPGDAPGTPGHQNANLSVNHMNPRLSSPQGSPSPIPQPAVVSGGRPPSNLHSQGAPINFGQHSGDNNDPNGMSRNLSQFAGHGNEHMRRTSSQSMHADMSGNPNMTPNHGRTGYQMNSNRGKNFQSPYNMQASYSPNHNNYRSHANRGMQQPYNNRGPSSMPYSNSPQMASRSPAIANAVPNPQMSQMFMVPQNMQGHPTYPMGFPQVNNQFSSSASSPSSRKPTRGKLSQGQQRGPLPGGRGRGRGRSRDSSEPPFVPSRDPASNHYRPELVSGPPLFSFPDLSPESGNFEHFLTHCKTQGAIPIQHDPSLMYHAAHMNNNGSHNYNNNYGAGSPRNFYPHGYAVPMQASFSNQGVQPPSMSRQGSQMSVTDRPASRVDHQQNQSNVNAPPGPAQSTARQASVPTPKPEYFRPAKKSSALQIKNEAGEVITFNKPAASPSPAPTPATSTATTTVTPPTRTGATPEKAPTEIKSTPVKSEEEKSRVKEEFARKIAESQEKERLEKELAEKAEMEREAAQAAEHAAEEAKQKAEAAEREAQAADAREAAAQQAEEQKKAEAESVEERKPESPASSEPAADEKTQEELDMEALEAEYAAMEAEEARREEEYQKKKAAAQEASRRKEQEEADRYEATLKEMERKAEEEEVQREKEKEAGSGDEAAKKMFAALKSEHDADTPASDASPAHATPNESGAATPTSDISMPPPARAPGAGKRAKVVELTLDVKKPSEPAEPSAALRSLQSAKKLDDLSKVTYPADIKAPNAAINANVPADRRFKYDKEFLLQFQKVFTEKPSLEWDSKIRDALGDPEASARAGGSARTPSGMGGRSASNRVNQSAANAFAGPMGAFTGAPRLPPGTTSAERFAASNAAIGRGAMPQNPFAQFGRPGQMGVPMAKAPSGNPLGALPGSPRVGGASRGGSRAESKRNKHSAKQLAEENKSMPLTAGMNVGSLEVSATGWKPRSIGQASNAGPQPGGEGLLEPDVVQRKVKAALNKMTPENLQRIGDQILDIAAQSKHESDGRTLRQVIQLTFEKATDEAHWAGMYAMFCRRMLESMSADIKDENIKDKNGQVVTGGALFRKYLLNRCQEEFERGWKVNLPERQKAEGEEAALLSDEYYVAAAAKRRGLGLVKFIGELFKLGMLTERIMHECVKKLVDYEGTPDEAEVESLVSLLRTIGRQLDDPESKAHGRMDVYFDKINQAINIPDLPSRIRFMLMDVVDLRKNNWISKEADKGPTTIQEIHAKAEQAARDAELQRIANQQNNRGGGGRLPMGRGDVRSLSGYGQVPPPDTSNRIATDDLRRLGKNTRNPSSTTGAGSLGPSTLLGPRTNSNRRGLGPGSLLGRGDDSNQGSRSSTNPGQKEKKDEANMNAFSALAALENDGPASPPSNPGSPPTQKSQANIERERSRSPEKAS